MAVASTPWVAEHEGTSNLLLLSSVAVNLSALQNEAALSSQYQAGMLTKEALKLLEVQKEMSEKGQRLKERKI